jgi:hypothetical protein
MHQSSDFFLPTLTSWMNLAILLKMVLQLPLKVTSDQMEEAPLSVFFGTLFIIFFLSAQFASSVFLQLETPTQDLRKSDKKTLNFQSLVADGPM